MPRKAPSKGEPGAVSVLVPADVRERLEQAARANHRSVTKEVAARMEWSLGARGDLYDGIEKIIRAIESYTGKPWNADPWATLQVAKAAHDLAVQLGASADGEHKLPEFVKPVPKGIDAKKLGQELVMYLQLFGSVP